MSVFRNDTDNFELNLEFMAPIGKWNLFFSQGINNKEMKIIYSDNLEYMK